MKFKDIFLFLEQEHEEDPLDFADPWDGGEDPLDAAERGENDPELNPPRPNAPEDRPRVAPPKKLSAKEQIKQKWLSQDPGITDDQMEEAIGFFNSQRQRLRPYHPYGYIDPQTNRHYINLPEITSIVIRFPEMETILSDRGRLNDLKNYPWEVISFYQDIVQANNDIIDEENIVPGTRLPFEEQLELAKQTFMEPQGLIINENGLLVHRIESKNESIKFGSIQRILSLERRKTNTHGNVYWCTTVPLNDNSRSNLWTSYRPGGHTPQGFYYVWDADRLPDDKYHFTSVNPLPDNESYKLIDLYNATNTMSWDEVVERIPKLQGKQEVIRYYGATPKEKQDLTLDQITMTIGHKYYFGTVPEKFQTAYVDSGRHVNDINAFLTMRPATRKLYVDKTSKINNDLQNRFLSNDPNSPFGILELLRLQKKPEDLYKYLDVKILKAREEIPEGIMAIKRIIIGTNWKTSLRDPKNGYTLVLPRDDRLDIRRQPKYGIMDIDNADIIKDFNYTLTSTKSFLHVYNEDGIKRRKIYVYQRYVYTLGNNQADANEQFTFLCLKEALTDKSSPNYLLGQYFNGTDGDAFIQEKLRAGELIKI